MKSIIVFAAITASFFVASGLYAQSNPVPDSSFESWSAGHPDGWAVDSFVFQSSDAHSGLWAAGGNVLSGDSGAPFLLAAIPIEYRPYMLEGYYKLTSIEGDEIMFFVDATCSATPVAQAIFVDSSSTSEYKHFSIPILYSDENVPDSAAILIEMQNPKGLLHPGSSFVVDDISLTGTSINKFVSVKPAPPASQFGSVQNYPNPFSKLTTISLTTQGGYADISIMNLLGEEVARIFSGELISGEHTFTWNADENMPGMYECFVRQSESVQRIPIECVR